MSAYRNNAFKPEPSMNKLQSLFITCRAFPFGRFLLLLLMLGSVGIGGHAVYGAAKGCTSRTPTCHDRFFNKGSWSEFECPEGTRLELERDQATGRCTCIKPNEAQKDGGD